MHGDRYWFTKTKIHRILQKWNKYVPFFNSQIGNLWVCRQRKKEKNWLSVLGNASLNCASSAAGPRKNSALPFRKTGKPLPESKPGVWA